MTRFKRKTWKGSIMKIRTNLRAGLALQRDRCGGTTDRCGGTRCGGTTYY